jgi:hypothetical protein
MCSEIGAFIGFERDTLRKAKSLASISASVVFLEVGFAWRPGHPSRIQSPLGTKSSRPQEEREQSL